MNIDTNNMCDRLAGDPNCGATERGPLGDIDWRQRPLRELVGYVRATHHEYTRAELAHLRTLLEKVVKVHAATHPELATVKKLFDELESDLLPHMMKEERFLFPYIERLEAATEGAPVPRAPFGSVENPVRMMRTDHERDGALLESLRATTSAFEVPSGACASYAALYDGLKRLDLDLRRHMHLENQVLFPRAIEIETRLRQPT